MHTEKKAKKLIEVCKLKKHFPVKKGVILNSVKGWIKAVDGVDFAIHEGETFGLVGESGCGKTTTAKLILKLDKPTGGSIYYRGSDISAFSSSDLKAYRQSVQVVMQDPTSALNPRMRIGEIVSEPLIVNNVLEKTMMEKRAAEVLSEVELRPSSVSMYPHEFSGGQRQRIAIARALSSQPHCIILDEPVSALDVSIRAQILNLLKGLQERLKLTYLMISHDLAAVRHMSHRIGVMYLGKLVEMAESEELYFNTLHPYTQALLSAALPFHPDAKHTEIMLPGETPSPFSQPIGCSFHPRCQFAMQICSEVEPSFQKVSTGHWVACHLLAKPKRKIGLSNTTNPPMGFSPMEQNRNFTMASH
jgi:oligopeptide/dipeptide ABC transporter ATP-binding protein